MKKILVYGKDNKNRYSIVDNDDYEFLSKYKWRISDIYAYARINRKSVYMHRLILNVPKEKETDHVNGNGLDNRRKNIRICTISQNNFNKALTSRNKSGYKGVSWNKQYKKWEADIELNGNKKYIGRYLDKKEAAKAYNREAIRTFGEFAWLNKI